MNSSPISKNQGQIPWHNPQPGSERFYGCAPGVHISW